MSERIVTISVGSVDGFSPVRRLIGSCLGLVIIALLPAMAMFGCAKTVAEKKSERTTGPTELDAGVKVVETDEPVDPVLEEGWKKETVRQLSFVRPEDWKLSTNPMAPPHSNQLKMFSPDNKVTIMITLTKWRDDMTLTEAVQMSSRGMGARMMGVPKFRGSTMEGGGSENELWGRKGVLTYFKLVAEPEQENDEKQVLLSALIYGELIQETTQVLFINVFTEGDDDSRAEKVIRSLQIQK